MARQAAEAWSLIECTMTTGYGGLSCWWDRAPWVYPRWHPRHVVHGHRATDNPRPFLF
jgi:hypothetical protein